MPPSAEVRDIPPTAYEKRLLRNVLRFIDHQPARLARNRILGWVLAIVGLSCFLAATSIGDVVGDPFWVAVIAAAGGFVAGLSVVLRASARNWPILRRYFDVDRLRADCERLRTGEGLSD